MRAAAGAACCGALLLGTPLLAEPARDASLGRRLYVQGTLATGERLAVTLPGGGSLRGRAAACAICHRPSGFGGVEGGLYIPPITGPYLFGGRVNRRIDLFHVLFQEDLASATWARLRQRSDRPAYSAGTFRDALESGHDPNGRPFDALMPRYALSEGDLANLVAFLATLGAAPDPGVDDETIRFATVVEGSGTARDRQSLAVMQAFIRLKNADTARLRRISPDPLGHEDHFAPAYRTWDLVVWRLGSDAEGWQRELESSLAERPVFGVLGGPGGAAGERLAAFCELRALPCLLLEEGHRHLENGASTRRVPAAPCPSGSTVPPQAFRSRQWLRARGIPPAAQDRAALAVHFLLSVAEAALMHVLDDFSRAYFLESFDREIRRVPNPLACEAGSSRQGS